MVFPTVATRLIRSAGLRAAIAPRVRTLCAQAKPAGGTDDGKAVAERPYERDGVVVKNYGSGLVLPEVTKEQAENSFLEATDVRRAMTPPVSVAVEARDDMLKDRFNYVSTNLNPAARYVVMGQDGKTVAPDVSACVLRSLPAAAPSTRVPEPASCCRQSSLVATRPPRRRAGHLRQRVRRRRRPRADGRHHWRRLHPHSVGGQVAQGARR